MGLEESLENGYSTGGGSNRKGVNEMRMVENGYTCSNAIITSPSIGDSVCHEFGPSCLYLINKNNKSRNIKDSYIWTSEKKKKLYS